ncbi:hypothetical protein CHUAL_011565 [Chamberlinius hualienensis]
MSSAVLRFCFILTLHLFTVGISAVVINQRSWVEYNENSSDWTGVSECFFDIDSDNGHDITWHYNGSVIGIESTSTELEELISKLYIRNFSQHAVGDYTCFLVTSDSELHSSDWIYAAPIISSTQHPYNANDRVDISCTLYTGSNLYWILPNAIEEINLIKSTDEANESISIQFLANQSVNYAPIRCCSSKGLNQKTPIPCSSTYINVYSAPVLIDAHVSCDELTCNATCSFQAFPDLNAADIIWQVCVKDECVLYEKEMINYYDDESHVYVSQIKNAEEGQYVCSAFNSMSNVSHTFDLQQFYSSPNATSMDTLVLDKTSIAFECKFSARPPPSDYIWMKQAVLTESYGWQIISASEYVNGNLSEDEFYSVLYLSEDYELNYSCCAANSLGKVCSSSTLHTPLELEVNVSNLSPSDDELVVVDCFALGIPFPRIEVNVVSEFNIQYDLSIQSEINVTHAQLSYVANWVNNPAVYIRCSAFYDDLSVELTSKSVAVYVKHNPEMTSVNNCSVEDFTSNGSCQLRCKTRHSKQDLLSDWKWIYWIDEIDNGVNIYDSLSVSYENPYNFELKLNLTNYYAANYSCYIAYNRHNLEQLQMLNLTHTFIIDPDVNGANMNEECEKSQQCLPLNINCVNGYCECTEPFIYIANTSTSIACLAASGPFEPCNIDAQCVDLNFFCSSEKSICDCNGTYTDVPDASKYLCLQPVENGGCCGHYEECLLNDRFTQCLNGYCQCDTNFIFNETMQQCLFDNSTQQDSDDDDNDEYEWTIGAIIGIIIGGASFISLIICTVGLIIGRRRGLI